MQEESSMAPVQDQPQVDVLMATYNRRNLIFRAINSVINQTYQNWKLYIYDDGSDYDFNEVIGCFNDERIQFFIGEKIEPKKRISRLAVVNNILAELSDGDLVSYLCDDDYYWPEAIESAVSFFNNNPEKHVAYGKLTNSDRKVENMKIPRERRHTMFRGSVLTKDPTGSLDLCQIVHKRECFGHTRWPEEQSGWGMEDAYFFRELIKKYPFYPIDVYFANRYLHEGGLRELMAAQDVTNPKRESVL